MTREEAIKVLRETYCGNRAFCELFKVDLCLTTDCEIYHAIKALDAEPTKHGRWLKTGQSLVYSDKFRNYFCSACGFELDTHIRQEPNYCPNCGAHMMEEVEE